MIFHSFILGDCEDPEIYAAQPIYEWQQTEMGQWVMKHGYALTFDVSPDIYNYGYRVNIRGCLAPEDEIYFTLKYK